jgi:hypothetical protein
MEDEHMSNPQEDINNTNPAHQGAGEQQTGREDSRPGQDKQSRSAPPNEANVADNKQAPQTTPGQGTGIGGHD